MSRPRVLTPADRSATERPGLAHAIRRRHTATDELPVGHAPSADECAAAVARARDAALVVVGSLVEPSCEALAAACFGEIGLPGRLPVRAA